MLKCFVLCMQDPVIILGYVLPTVHNLLTALEKTIAQQVAAHKLPAWRWAL